MDRDNIQELFEEVADVNFRVNDIKNAAGYRADLTKKRPLQAAQIICCVLELSYRDLFREVNVLDRVK